jgi:hypothetical protein
LEKDKKDKKDKKKEEELLYEPLFPASYPLAQKKKLRTIALLPFFYLFYLFYLFPIGRNNPDNYEWGCAEKDKNDETLRVFIFFVFFRARVAFYRIK